MLAQLRTPSIARAGRPQAVRVLRPQVPTCSSTVLSGMPVGAHEQGECMQK